MLPFALVRAVRPATTDAVVGPSNPGEGTSFLVHAIGMVGRADHRADHGRAGREIAGDEADPGRGGPVSPVGSVTVALTCGGRWSGRRRPRRTRRRCGRRRGTTAGCPTPAPPRGRPGWRYRERVGSLTGRRPAGGDRGRRREERATGYPRSGDLQRDAVHGDGATGGDDPQVAAAGRQAAEVCAGEREGRRGHVSVPCSGTRRPCGCGRRSSGVVVEGPVKPAPVS